jgi:hypothetical protein
MPPGCRALDIAIPRASDMRIAARSSSWLACRTKSMVAKFPPQRTRSPLAVNPQHPGCGYPRCSTGFWGLSKSLVEGGPGTSSASAHFKLSNTETFLDFDVPPALIIAGHFPQPSIRCRRHTRDRRSAFRPAGTTAIGRSSTLPQAVAAPIAPEAAAQPGAPLSPPRSDSEQSSVVFMSVCCTRNTTVSSPLGPYGAGVVAALVNEPYSRRMTPMWRLR